MNEFLFPIFFLVCVYMCVYVNPYIKHVYCFNVRAWCGVLSAHAHHCLLKCIGL